MQGATGAINVLFITGFGPIVRDTTQSRKLYSETSCTPPLRSPRPCAASGG